MTVEELITALSKLDPGREVLVCRDRTIKGRFITRPEMFVFDVRELAGDAIGRADDPSPIAALTVYPLSERRAT